MMLRCCVDWIRRSMLRQAFMAGLDIAADGFSVGMCQHVMLWLPVLAHPGLCTVYSAEYILQCTECTCTGSHNIMC